MKFQEVWLFDPSLKEWVAKDPRNPEKALCRVCDDSMEAKKSNLLRHGESEGHVKKCEEKGVPVIYVGPAIKNPGKFNPEWTREFPWIGPVPGNPGQCQCTICPSSKPFRAHRGDVLRHESTNRHKIFKAA